MSLEVQVFDNLKVKEENGQILFDAESAAIKIGISLNKKRRRIRSLGTRSQISKFSTSGER